MPDLTSAFGEGFRIMIIRRDRSRGRWTSIPNEAFEVGPADGGLSLEAKGLLGWLLVKPDTWTVNVTAIRERCGVGRDAAYALLNELIAVGYVERRQVRGGGRVIRYEYVVFDVPASSRRDELLPDSQEAAVVQVPSVPHTVKPDTVKPDTVKPDTYIRSKGDKTNKGGETSVTPLSTGGGDPRDDQRMFDELCRAFRVTPGSVTAKTRGQFNRWIKGWRDDGVGPEDMARAVALYLSGFKGRRQEPPSRHDLEVQIGRARAQPNDPSVGPDLPTGRYMAN